MCNPCFQHHCRVHRKLPNQHRVQSSTLFAKTKIGSEHMHVMLSIIAVACFTSCAHSASSSISSNAASGIVRRQKRPSDGKKLPQNIHQAKILFALPINIRRVAHRKQKRRERERERLVAKACKLCYLVYDEIFCSPARYQTIGATRRLEKFTSLSNHFTAGLSSEGAHLSR